MTIQVKCYATLAVHTPENSDAYPLAPGATVASVLAALNVQAEDVKLIFVNGAKAEPETVLQNGDRLGLFPAVGGG